MIPLWQRVPGFVLPGASVDMNFAAGLYYPSDVSTLISTTRASNGYAQTSTGLLVNFGSNIPRITDLGLLVEQAATNLAIQSADLSNSAWAKSHGGVSLNPAVTANFAIAPDGTQTAARVQFNLNGGTTATDNSELVQLASITVLNATNYTVSGYIKTNDASTVAMQLGDNAQGLYGAISVTGTWTRFSFTITTANTTGKWSLKLRGAQTPTNSQVADVSVWIPGYELGNFATSPIATTTVAVTRAADNIKFSASEFSLFSPTQGSFFIDAMTSPDIGVPQCGLVSADDGTTSNYITLRGNNTHLGQLVINSGGVNQTTIGVGVIAANTRIKGASSWIVGTANISVNGSASAAGTPGAIPVVTEVTLGQIPTNSLYLNNYIRRMAYYSNQIPSSSLTALTV